MKKSTLHHITMYQNVLAVVNDHQSVWSGIQSMSSAVNQLNDLLSSLSSKLNVQSTITQGVRLEKQAFVQQLKEEMVLLKKALFLHAVETGNLPLRERHKESKSKVIATSVDRLEILSISLLEDLEVYGQALGTIGITPQQILEFSSKVTELASRKNSVRQAIIERAVETSQITELEKAINSLIIDRLDRFMSFFKSSNSSFFNTYRGARRIIANGGNTAPRTNERDDGSLA